MFKTKNELIKEIKARACDENIKNACIASVGDAFESFAERVEFYKEWENNLYGFYKKFRKDLVKMKEHKIRTKGDFFKRHDTFNDWLFDYCFGDVANE